MTIQASRRILKVVNFFRDKFTAGVPEVITIRTWRKHVRDVIVISIVSLILAVGLVVVGIHMFVPDQKERFLKHYNENR